MDLTRLYTLCYRYYTLSIYAVSFYIVGSLFYIVVFYIVFFLLYIERRFLLYKRKKNISLELEVSYLADMLYMLDILYMSYQDDMLLYVCICI